MIHFIPLVSAIVSFIFALVVLDQFFARRKPYQLIWTIGLFMYAISTATEFCVGAWGLNVTVYRLWYLFGAIFVAAYLGMGTLYLLTRRHVAHIIMAILLAASFYAAFRVSTASIDLSDLQVLSGIAMPQGVRFMTPLFNTFGTVSLVGGAIYSAWVFWRRKIMPHRVVSNILIAVGAILTSRGWNSHEVSRRASPFLHLRVIRSHNYLCWLLTKPRDIRLISFPSHSRLPQGIS